MISRAVCSPVPWLPLAIPWTAPGGIVIGMLGREIPAAEELRRLGERHDALLTGVHELYLPRSGAKRALAVWRRNGP